MLRSVVKHMLSLFTVRAASLLDVVQRGEADFVATYVTAGLFA
jgi:hypothetical protein